MLRGRATQLLGHRTAMGIAVALVVLAALYGGLATFMSGHVASQSTVDGIDIGGMSSREATVTLEHGLAGRAPRPVHLMVSSRSVRIQPEAAGLKVDVAATMDGLTGFTLNPLRMWSHLTQAARLPFALQIDRAKLTAAVTRAAGVLDKPVRQGSIAFADGTATSVLPVAGTVVKVPETVDAVASAWPQRQNVQAVVTVTQPKVSAAEIRRATKELAIPAMSAPVTILAGSPAAPTVVLQPRQYASSLSVTVDTAGRVVLRVNPATLLATIRKVSPRAEHRPVDATVRLVAGRPRVVPAVAGSKLDGRAVSAAFLPALTSTSRTATVGLVPAVPTVTTAMAQRWQITEPISAFTTQFPVNPPRTNNIKTAVATLNGTLVPPGEQFSLNATLGQRTPAKGYAKAPVIYGGRLVSDYGGGVSQVSTTTFNAAFFAGVRITEHTAHSFYIARYPEGREATVSWPDVDQKWTNDTGFGILIQASVSGDNLTVTLWGTKTRDVAAVKGSRRNIRAPKVIVDAKPGCVPQMPTPGFDVTVTQIFRKNGAQVKTVRFTTHYIPEDSVTCTAPPAA